MNLHAKPLISALLTALWLFAGVISAQELVLTEVPTYYWHHGCSPTSGTMLFGYWDAHGYHNLIPGSNDWNTNQNNIQNAIASPGNVSDYALYEGINDYGWNDPHPDMSEINPSGTHTDDSMADFMGTSRSDSGLTHGATWISNIDDGLDDYATYKGYSFNAEHKYYSWNNFINEIKFARPVVLHVDSSGNGTVDHSITAIGYRTSNGYDEYAFRSTWQSDGTNVRWERFRYVSSSYDWGVLSMEIVRPNSTWDTAWNATSGYWHNSSSWDNSVPDANAFTYIPQNYTATITTTQQVRMLNNQGTIHMQSSLSAGDIRNYSGHIFLEHSNAQLNSSRAILNDGQLTIINGSLFSNTLEIGAYKIGTLTQSAGTNTTTNLTIGQLGTYNIDHGSITTANLYVGTSNITTGNPTLNITDPSAIITVSNSLTLGPTAHLNAVPNATIHMTGSSFENYSTDPDNLADLSNLTLIFEGGPTNLDPFEIASQDMGQSMSGFYDNFAFGTLTLGANDIAMIQLTDSFDNQPDWSGAEALYVTSLNLSLNSYLDLNGLNLYCLNFTDLGASINLNGGTLTQMLLGDYNLDSIVDQADYTIWADTYSQTGTGLLADGNGDRVIDQTDYTIWADNFGSTLTSPPTPPSPPTPIPEPTTLTLIALTTLTFLRQRKTA